MTQNSFRCPHCGDIIQPSPLTGAAHTLESYIAAVNEDQPAVTVEKAPPPRQQDLQPDTLEAYVELAETAARQRHLPAFNSYSRRAIDAKPDDRRMYAWRARLAEEADAFANLIWATPVWYLYTPRQKRAFLQQHFYALNTALQYSNHRQKEELIQRIARLLLRQAVDLLTERAQLRCKRRLVGRTFRGRYRRVDLLPTREFCDAVKCIDDQVCPLGHEQLRQAIRTEALALPRKLAQHLIRF